MSEFEASQDREGGDSRSQKSQDWEAARHTKRPLGGQRRTVRRFADVLSTRAKLTGN
jgi:hypothetical protein